MIISCGSSEVKVTLKISLDGLGYTSKLVTELFSNLAPPNVYSTDDEKIVAYEVPLVPQAPRIFQEYSPAVKPNLVFEVNEPARLFHAQT